MAWSASIERHKVLVVQYLREDFDFIHELFYLSVVIVMAASLQFPFYVGGILVVKRSNLKVTNKIKDVPTWIFKSQVIYMHYLDFIFIFDKVMGLVGF